MIQLLSGGVSHARSDQKGGCGANKQETSRVPYPSSEKQHLFLPYRIKGHTGKLRKTRMLPADEKQLHKDINQFQDDLSSSPAFRNIYGPVSFKDDDFETSLDFMKQLIQIKEEEIVAAMQSEKNKQTSGSDLNNLQKRVQEIMTFVEKGDFSTAREAAEKDEEATDALMESYNTSGIQSRKEKDFERAIMTFKKALFVRPDDEGLYYNMARPTLKLVTGNRHKMQWKRR